MDEEDYGKYWSGEIKPIRKKEKEESKSGEVKDSKDYLDTQENYEGYMKPSAKQKRMIRKKIKQKEKSNLKELLTRILIVVILILLCVGTLALLVVTTEKNEETAKQEYIQEYSRDRLVNFTIDEKYKTPRNGKVFYYFTVKDHGETYELSVTKEMYETKQMRDKVEMYVDEKKGHFLLTDEKTFIPVYR